VQHATSIFLCKKWGLTPIPSSILPKQFFLESTNAVIPAKAGINLHFNVTAQVYSIEDEGGQASLLCKGQPQGR
jgi:hypothetical protein